MVLSLPLSPTTADQQQMILMFELPLRGQRLAREVGWARGAEPGAASDVDEMFDSCPGSEDLSLLICAMSLGCPSFSCSMRSLSLSIR